MRFDAGLAKSVESSRADGESNQSEGVSFWTVMRSGAQPRLEVNLPGSVLDRDNIIAGDEPGHQKAVPFGRRTTDAIPLTKQSLLETLDKPIDEFGRTIADRLITLMENIAKDPELDARSLREATMETILRAHGLQSESSIRVALGNEKPAAGSKLAEFLAAMEKAKNGVGVNR
jgi:hypothetical protein